MKVKKKNYLVKSYGNFPIADDKDYIINEEIEKKNKNIDNLNWEIKKSQISLENYDKIKEENLNKNQIIANLERQIKIIEESKKNDLKRLESNSENNLKILNQNNSLEIFNLKEKILKNERIIDNLNFELNSIKQDQNKNKFILTEKNNSGEIFSLKEIINEKERIINDLNFQMNLQRENKQINIIEEENQRNLTKIIESYSTEIRILKENISIKEKYIEDLMNEKKNVVILKAEEKNNEPFKDNYELKEELFKKERQISELRENLNFKGKTIENLNFELNLLKEDKKRNNSSSIYFQENDSLLLKKQISELKANLNFKERIIENLNTEIEFFNRSDNKRKEIPYQSKNPNLYKSRDDFYGLNDNADLKSELRLKDKIIENLKSEINLLKNAIDNKKIIEPPIQMHSSNFYKSRDEIYGFNNNVELKGELRFKDQIIDNLKSEINLLKNATDNKKRNEIPISPNLYKSRDDINSFKEITELKGELRFKDQIIENLKSELKNANDNNKRIQIPHQMHSSNLYKSRDDFYGFNDNVELKGELMFKDKIIENLKSEITLLRNNPTDNSKRIEISYQSHSSNLYKSRDKIDDIELKGELKFKDKIIENLKSEISLLKDADKRRIEITHQSQNSNLYKSRDDFYGFNDITELKGELRFKDQVITNLKSEINSFKEAEKKRIEIVHQMQNSSMFKSKDDFHNFNDNVELKGELKFKDQIIENLKSELKNANNNKQRLEIPHQTQNPNLYKSRDEIYGFKEITELKSEIRFKDQVIENLKNRVDNKIRLEIPHQMKNSNLYKSRDEINGFKEITELKGELRFKEQIIENLKSEINLLKNIDRKRNEIPHQMHGSNLYKSRDEIYSFNDNSELKGELIFKEQIIQSLKLELELVKENKKAFVIPENCSIDELKRENFELKAKLNSKEQIIENLKYELNFLNEEKKKLFMSAESMFAPVKNNENDKMIKIMTEFSALKEDNLKKSRIIDDYKSEIVFNSCHKNRSAQFFGEDSIISMGEGRDYLIENYIKEIHNLKEEIKKKGNNMENSFEKNKENKNKGRYFEEDYDNLVEKFHKEISDLKEEIKKKESLITELNQEITMIKNNQGEINDNSLIKEKEDLIDILKKEIIHKEELLTDNEKNYMNLEKEMKEIIENLKLKLKEKEENLLLLEEKDDAEIKGENLELKEILKEKEENLKNFVERSEKKYEELNLMIEEFQNIVLVKNKEIETFQEKEQENLNKFKNICQKIEELKKNPEFFEENKETFENLDYIFGIKKGNKSSEEEFNEKNFAEKKRIDLILFEKNVEIKLILEEKDEILTENLKLKQKIEEFQLNFVKKEEEDIKEKEENLSEKNNEKLREEGNLLENFKEENKILKEKLENLEKEFLEKENFSKEILLEKERIFNENEKICKKLEKFEDLLIENKNLLKNIDEKEENPNEKNKFSEKFEELLLKMAELRNNQVNYEEKNIETLKNELETSLNEKNSLKEKFFELRNLHKSKNEIFLKEIKISLENLKKFKLFLLENFKNEIKVIFMKFNRFLKEKIEEIKEKFGKGKINEKLEKFNKMIEIVEEKTQAQLINFCENLKKEKEISLENKRIYEEKIAVLQEENEILRKKNLQGIENTELKEIFQNFEKNSIEKLMKTNDDLLKTNESLNSKIENYASSLENLRKSNDEYLNKIEENLSELIGLRQKNKGLLEINELLEDKAKTIENKNFYFINVEEKYKEISEKFEEKVKNVRDLVEMRDVLQNKLQESNLNLKSKIKEVSTFEENIEKLKQKIKSDENLREEFEKLEKKLKSLENVEEELESLRKQLKDKETLMEKYKKLRISNENISNEIEELKNKLKDKQKIQEINEKYKIKLKSFENMEKEVEEIKNQLKDKEKLKEINEKMKIKIKSLQKFEKEVEELKVTIKNMEKIEENYKKLKIKLKNLEKFEQENEELRNKLKNQEKLEEFNKKLKTKIKNFENLEEEVEILKDKLNKDKNLKKINENLKQKNQNLDEKLKNLEKNQRNFEEIKIINEELSEFNLNLKRKLKGNKNLESFNENLIEKIKKMERIQDKLIDDIKNSENLEEIINDLKEKLRKCEKNRKSLLDENSNFNEAFQSIFIFLIIF